MDPEPDSRRAAHERRTRTTSDCRWRRHRRSDQGACVVRLLEQVLIIERDEITDRPVIHKSVPQANHLHALLHGGLQALSLLYPAFTEDLRQRGATQITVGRDIVWYLPDGKAYSPTGSVRAPFDTGLEAYCASRGLIEFVIRKRTTAIPIIRFESGSAVRELIYRDRRPG